jgi:hypothetical protein
MTDGKLDARWRRACHMQQRGSAEPTGRGVRQLIRKILRHLIIPHDNVLYHAGH